MYIIMYKKVTLKLIKIYFIEIIYLNFKWQYKTINNIYINIVYVNKEFY